MQQGTEFLTVSLVVNDNGTDQQRDAQMVEGFNSPVRDEHLFPSLRHVCRVIAAWREDCNHNCPHSSLVFIQYLDDPLFAGFSSLFVSSVEEQRARTLSGAGHEPLIQEIPP